MKKKKNKTKKRVSCGFYKMCAKLLLSKSNKDLRRIYFIKKGLRILGFITFYQNVLTRVRCASFYQSALRHEQHEDLTPSSSRQSF